MRMTTCSVRRAHRSRLAARARRNAFGVKNSCVGRLCPPYALLFVTQSIDETDIAPPAQLRSFCQASHIVTAQSTEPANLAAGMEASDVKARPKERGSGHERNGRKTRADELRLQLADEIVRGALAPGAALEEAEIARRFMVSRTPVREALRQLAASGLIVSRPHRVSVVARPGRCAASRHVRSHGRTRRIACRPRQNG